MCVCVCIHMYIYISSEPPHIEWLLTAMCRAVPPLVDSR